MPLIPARDVPVPSSVSPEAQAILGMPIRSAPPLPPLDDPDAWRTMIAETDKAMIGYLGARSFPVDVEQVDVEGVPIYAIRPHGTPTTDRRVCLDIHGGGLILGAGECCRAMGQSVATRVGALTWSVDYRMPPDHPYPAALDDCLTVYRALLRDHDPAEIVVSGASAGGNLAAALMLRARDEGLPLPAATVLLTPQVDLTESGDSFRTNRGLDPILNRDHMPAHLLYAAGHDLTHPYLSPLFGDFAAGFPPTLLTTGTRDLFLSNTVRMHRALRAAGIPAELHVFEAAPHGGFQGTAPEDAELEAEVRRFVDAHWSAG